MRVEDSMTKKSRRKCSTSSLENPRRSQRKLPRDYSLLKRGQSRQEILYFDVPLATAHALPIVLAGSRLYVNLRICR